MFSKPFNYFVFIFLIIPLPAFSSLNCVAENFLPETEDRLNPIRTKIENYRQFLAQSAQSILEIRRLSPQQTEALETYYDIVRGETGKDETFVRVGNYTFPQVKRIVGFLRKVFSPEQTAILIESGVIEINRIEPLKKNSRKAQQHLFEGKPFFVRLHGRDQKIHQGKAQLLEKTDETVLLRVEKINTESGQVSEEQWFFSRIGQNDKKFSSLSGFGSIEIVEKMDNGFVCVIKTETQDRFFFSFKKAKENGLLPQNPTPQDHHELESMLNKYFSRQWGQIPALKEAFHNDILDKDHSAYKDFIASLDKSIINESSYIIDNALERNKVIALNPEMEAVYAAIKSTRRKVSINEFNPNLLPPTDIESQLAEQGYTTGYISGLNLKKRWISIPRELQRLLVNPYITHIEYFELLIPYYIAHIRKGLEENYSPEDESYGSKSEQLQKLKDLKEEIKKDTDDENIIYKRFLEFIMKLAEIMSGKPESDPYAIKEIEKLVTDTFLYFPLKVTIPTIEGNIGIITFRKTGIEGAFPVGLINQQSREVHGLVLSAFRYLMHDYFHASTTGNQIYREYSIGHRLFHRRLTLNIESLPPEKRKKAEAVYATMTRENDNSNNISYSDWTLQEIRDEVAEYIGDNETDLFKFTDDPGQKERKIETLTDIFMEVYNKALQHQY